MALIDGKFKPLQGNLVDKRISLNMTAHDDHVGDMEQYI